MSAPLAAAAAAAAERWTGGKASEITCVRRAITELDNTSSSRKEALRLLRANSRHMGVWAHLRVSVCVSVCRSNRVDAEHSDDSLRGRVRQANDAPDLL
jgi:hypothetical protein